MIGPHGHVTPRPDGVKARCGGLGICAVCSQEKAQKAQLEAMCNAQTGVPDTRQVPAEPTDTQMLDWLMHRLPGSALRGIGVITSAGGIEWAREAIAAAMKEHP
jgi:hypothetical protein